MPDCQLRPHAQVPRSSKTISEDNDYTLCSVVLFKRVVDDFKSSCRTKGFQVRKRDSPRRGAVEGGFSCGRDVDVIWDMGSQINPAAEIH
jgi:hypothetical protein